MSWLSRLGGFEQPKKAQQGKAMELQTQVPNRYIENVIRSMFWKDNIRFGNDSTSFVEDGYGGNVSIYSIVNYILSIAPNVKFEAQIKDGDKWVKDEGSELIKLINNPNPMDTYSSLINSVIGWKLLDGSTYIYAPRIELGANKGKTLELWSMPATNMQIVGGGVRKPIEGYKYSQWREMIPADDVLYMKYFNPVGAIDSLSGIFTGMSPLRAAVLTAKKANSAAQAGVSAYENNGAGGIVSKADSEWGSFTQENVDALEQRWQSNNGGANNYGKVAFTGGQIDFHRLNMSPADLRLGESELQAMRQLGGVYRFPTQLINDSEGKTYSNQAAAQKSVYSDTVIPEMQEIGQGIAKWLGPAYYGDQEMRIITDTSEIEVLQQDKKTQVSWLVDAWWLSPNEKRQEMNKPISPDPKMDEIFVPNNVTSMKDLDLLSEINVSSSGNSNE